MSKKINVALVCAFAFFSHFNLLWCESLESDSQKSQQILDLGDSQENQTDLFESQSSIYTDLQCPFIPVKSAFIHDFIFATPQANQTNQASETSQNPPNTAQPKKPNFKNPKLLPLKPTRPRVQIRGHGRGKMGENLRDISLDSTRNRTLSTFSANEISISQGYTLPLKGTPLEKIELTGAYTILSNNEHRLKAQIGRNFRRWDFALGYDFSNTDLSATYGNRIESNFTNHALRAKLGLNHSQNHRYSVNFSYQKGEKSGLLKSYGALENLWRTPNYDRISAYILGDSRISPNVRLKSKLYYNSFLNFSRFERVFSDFSDINTPFIANTPYSNSTNNYSWGLVESLAFSLNHNSDLRLGINLRRDNLKYTSTKWGNSRELVATHTTLSDISTTIFAEWMQKISPRVRFSVSGSYDRNDMFSAMTNNIANEALATQGWSLQGIVYVDLNDAWLIYLNAMKNSQVPSLKDTHIGACGARTMNPYSVESTFIYGIGTCIKW